ncbi:MAG TPA: hypothetical protein VE549_05355 [Myxococcaceae bacterium]|nr:hypothetical protein [Myxococcaceae bacterium]
MTTPEVQSWCCEIADGIALVAPRGWNEASMSLRRRGEQLRVIAIDARLASTPPPKPELGMDEAGRLGGMSAAFTEMLHLLHEQGVAWDGARAIASRPGADRVVLTLASADGTTATSVTLTGEHVDALFVSDAFLEALALAEPMIAERRARLAERLAGFTRWSYSQPEGRATFDFAGGRTLWIPAQLLGTWSPDDETWLWGWANSAVEPACTEAIERALRVDHRDPGFAVFWRERYPCEEAFATRVAWLAGVRAGASGVYRGRMGGAWTYLALME